MTRLDELDVVRLGGYVFNWKYYVRIQKIRKKQTKEFNLLPENVTEISPVPELKKNLDFNKTKVDYFLVVLILIIAILVLLLVN